MIFNGKQSFRNICRGNVGKCSDHVGLRNQYTPSTNRNRRSCLSSHCERLCVYKKSCESGSNNFKYFQKKRNVATKSKFSSYSNVLRGSQIIATSALNKCLKNVESINRGFSCSFSCFHGLFCFLCERKFLRFTFQFSLKIFEASFSLGALEN